MARAIENLHGRWNVVRSGSPAQVHARNVLAESTRADRLRAVCHRLAVEIGPRNVYHYDSLCRTSEFIEASFQQLGYTPTRQEFDARGKTFANVIAERRGTHVPEEIFLVGAHYDTHKDSPGANDNGSAIAALLELARVTPGDQ